MANYYDRDTKVAYVEQINAGKLTVTEAIFKRSGSEEEAIRLADQGDYEGSHRALKNQIKYLNQLADMYEDCDIVEEVKELHQNLDLMSEPFYNKEARKQMSYNVYNQKRGRRRKQIGDGSIAGNID